MSQVFIQKHDLVHKIRPLRATPIVTLVLIERHAIIQSND